MESDDLPAADPFILGVVEGFYGKPWTFEQRKRLFVREKDFGFRYFVYAPKDEAKHRRLWRELHDEVELLYLKELINSAKEQDVAFVYAISPGLDMVYSSQPELSLLEEKLKQVFGLGCSHFALLFDDIETRFHCSLDEKKFASLAKAQVFVSNEIAKKMDSECSFMFCPTEYCTNRAVPNIEESEYLNTIGTDLDCAFNIMWTGDRVVPEFITVAQIQLIRKVLRRKPLLWDNLHANDYDPRRIFLGPYAGRDIGIYDELSGILTNPNNQFECNFIPLHSLSLWCRNAVNKQPHILDDVCKESISKWIKQVTRNLPSEERVISQISAANPEISSSDMECELDSTYGISVDDLGLLVAFNYLPYSAGLDAERLFTEAKWLVETSSYKPDNWSQRGCHVISDAEKVINAIDRFLDCPNRQLAFEIYPMLSETRIILDMLIRHFSWLLNGGTGLSEERRAGFYTRFGINGQFNMLLTTILEPNSWFGGVMILPLADRFVSKAAQFVCSAIDYQDSSKVETILTSCMECNPVLCYTMLNSQDDILAVSFGCEKTTTLIENVENTFSTVTNEETIQDDCENTIPYWLNSLIILLKTDQSNGCSVVVTSSPTILPKMFENFLLSVNTAVKTLPIANSRFIFEKREDDLDESLKSLDYVREDKCERFSVFSCRHLHDEEMTSLP